MQKTIEEMKINEDKLNQTDLAMNNSIQSLTLTDQTLIQSDKTIKSDLSSVNQSLSSLRAVARVEPDVFFSVNNHLDKSLTLNQVLKYDTVVTNEGNGYNQQTGMFTCPVNGFYMFQIHAVSDLTKTFWLQLQHNDRELIDVNKD